MFTKTADEIAAEINATEGLSATVSSKTSGNGSRILVQGDKGTPSFNSIRISPAESSHGVANIKIGTSNGQLRIVNGSRSQFKGNIAAEEAAGTKFIFLK